MDTRGFARVGWIGGIRAFGIEAITHRSHITLIEVALSSFTLTVWALLMNKILGSAKSLACHWIAPAALEVSSPQA